MHQAPIGAGAAHLSATTPAAGKNTVYGRNRTTRTYAQKELEFNLLEVLDRYASKIRGRSGLTHQADGEA